MSDTLGTLRHKLFGPFLWVVTGAGSLAFLYSASRLNFHQLDSGFVILVAMTLVLSSQISVPIPRFSSQISVSDTFVFLLLLLYGGAAAVRSEEHTSELQSPCNLVCRLLLEKKKQQ